MTTQAADTSSVIIHFANPYGRARGSFQLQPLQRNLNLALRLPSSSPTLILQVIHPSTFHHSASFSGARFLHHSIYFAYIDRLNPTSSSLGPDWPSPLTAVRVFRRSPSPSVFHLHIVRTSSSGTRTPYRDNTARMLSLIINSWRSQHYNIQRAIT